MSSTTSLAHRWLQRLALLAMAWVLVGCASVEVRDTKASSPDDGAMLIRVLPNVRSSSQFFKNWQTLKVARQPRAGEGTEVEYAISPGRDDGASRSALYAGTLPPGWYRFVQFSSQQCGYLCVSARMDVDPRFSRFEVKPGQLTDLGVMVQTNAGDGTANALLTHDPGGGSGLTPELVRELLPELQPMLARPRLSWHAATVPSAMAGRYKDAYRGSFGFVSPRETEDGAFLHGSANGAVGRWQPGGGRQMFDIGERVSVDAVLALPDGRWIAAGEFSVVKLSADRGRSWQSLRGNLPLGLVVSLGLWRGQVLLTLARGKGVEVYRAPAGSDEWQLIASHATDVNWFLDVQGVGPQSLLLGDTLVTTVPGRQVAVLDLASGQAELRKLPGAIQMFSASADGVLRCRCLSALKVDPYESHDFGKTWVESTASRFMLMPAFKDKMNGVAFKGGFLSPSKFAYTSDGGKTWVETAEAPIHFHQLFFSRDGSKAFAASPLGDLWQTEDDGRSWRAVR